jgi:hypothetical protein
MTEMFGHYCPWRLLQRHLVLGEALPLGHVQARQPTTVVFDHRCPWSLHQHHLAPPAASQLLRASAR